MSQPLFHLTRNLYKPGDVIVPGNWGRVISATGQSHKCWEREQVLERIRRAEYANKPSRLSAVFAFFRVEDVLWLRAQPGRESDYGYVVLAADDSAPAHIGDMHGVGYVPAVDASPDDAARRYWGGRGKQMSPEGGFTIKELVTHSPLRLLSRVYFSDPT